MSENEKKISGTPLKTGIGGVDDILRGGLPPGCMYLVTGTPGSGKTTLAMQFLIEGARAGEQCLYVTLSESRSEINAVARSHGWDLSKIEIAELVPSERNLSADAQLTVFNPSELELGETTEAMIKEIERVKPKRVVLDSLSELRLVAQSALRYRRQILALKQFFAGRDATVLLLDDRSGFDQPGTGSDTQLESITHGVVYLEQTANHYGIERRRLRIVKMRGVSFRGGFHDLVIRRGGLEVFPRLVAAEHHSTVAEEPLASGNASLDTLICGGLPPGTSTLLLGPAGTGKSTVSTQFAVAAARRGQRTAMFIFDENLSTFRSRCQKLGLGVDEFIENGLITVQQIDPAELSPGEFAWILRRAVEGTDGASLPAKLIVIDSLNGYLNSMPEEQFLSTQMHEMLAYLGQKRVASLLSVTQSGMIGSAMKSPIDTTYLADNVLLFRYFEDRGRVRRAISVAKMRNAAHEFTIRELSSGPGGLKIGEPLTGFQGILTGVPTFAGNLAELSPKGHDGR